MNIGGFIKTTLLDYPGKVACTIFTNGCNLRCPFCQNGNLVLTGSNEIYEDRDVLNFLKKRQGILEGVCISGGEPTLANDLAEFICAIKDMGFMVKLDTNGTNPDIIENLYEGHLIDYVAMDFKSSYENYAKAAGANIDISRIKKSVQFLMSSGIDYEFRTTLVKGIHSFEDMASISSSLANAKAYFLQSYQNGDNILATLNKKPAAMSSFTDNELSHFLEIANKKIPAAKLRGLA